jgi:hypothetical protein
MARANGQFNAGEKCSFRSDSWPMCIACNGRMHTAECKSRKRKNRDCCPARH